MSRERLSPRRPAGFPSTADGGGVRVADIEALRAIGRVGGATDCRARDRFERDRPDVG